MKLSPINNRIRMQAGGQAHPCADGSASLGNRCALCFSHHHTETVQLNPTGTVTPIRSAPMPLFRKGCLGLKRQEVWSLCYLNVWNPETHTKKYFYINCEVFTSKWNLRKRVPWAQGPSVLFTALIPWPEQCPEHRRLSRSIYQMKQGKHKPRIITRLRTEPLWHPIRFQAAYQTSHD